MTSYDFILRIALLDEHQDPADYLNSLASFDCDDATVGIGAMGFISLDFTRNAESREAAIDLAWRQASQAIPEGRLIQVI